MTLIDATRLSEPKVAGESFFNSGWRPALAWTFIGVVIYDLILAPMLMQLIFALGGKPYQEWHPSTMLAGGMFFGAFGAILGTATYMRSQEKLAVFNGPVGSAMSSSSTTITSTEQKRDPPPVADDEPTKPGKGD